MKIAFFDLDGCEIPFINEQCKKAGIDVIKTSTEPLLETTDLSDVKDVDILSVFLSKVDKKIIEQLPNLKLISVRTTGIDGVDMALAQKKGIMVISVPAYAERTVAEYAMALILMLSRKLGVTLLQSMSGTFNRKVTRGNDLAGKTIGIIGTGKIGKRLVKMANGFDMNIILYDVRPDKELSTAYNAPYVSLETLFKTADVISIHVPYTKETHHLINIDTLKLLKKGVLIVNTARGPIIDTHAIRKGLKDGILGGVALDTFEGENIWIKEDFILDETELPSAEVFKEALEAFYLLKFKNVILSPHNAFNSCEAIQRMLDTVFADIVAFLQGKAVANRVG